MKVIIAGSRSVSDHRLVKWAIAESGFRVTDLVSGGARGVDRAMNLPHRLMPIQNGRSTLSGPGFEP